MTTLLYVSHVSSININKIMPKNDNPLPQKRKKCFCFRQFQHMFFNLQFNTVDFVDHLVLETGQEHKS